MILKNYLEQFNISTADVTEETWQAIESLNAEDKNYLTGAYLPFLKFIGDLGCIAYSSQNGIYFKGKFIFAGFAIESARCTFELTHRGVGQKAFNTSFTQLHKLTASGSISAAVTPDHTKFKLIHGCVSDSISLHNAWQHDVIKGKSTETVA